MSQSKNYQAKETQLNFECAQFHENTPTSSTENVISKPSSKETLKKLENKSRHEITEDDKLRTTKAFFQNHIKDRYVRTKSRLFWGGCLGCLLLSFLFLSILSFLFSHYFSHTLPLTFSL